MTNLANRPPVGQKTKVKKKDNKYLQAKRVFLP